MTMFRHGVLPVCQQCMQLMLHITVVLQFCASANWCIMVSNACMLNQHILLCRSLLPRLHYFQDGTCIVHHMFGGEVCELVAKGYRDAYLAAHFEVPGELFRLAMQAKRTRDMGVVGSTQNILDFIAVK